MISFLIFNLALCKMNQVKLRKCICQKNPIWCTKSKETMKDASFWWHHGSSKAWVIKIQIMNIGFSELNFYITTILSMISNHIKLVSLNQWLQESELKMQAVAQAKTWSKLEKKLKLNQMQHYEFLVDNYYLRFFKSIKKYIKKLS